MSGSTMNAWTTTSVSKMCDWRTSDVKKKTNASRTSDVKNVLRTTVSRMSALTMNGVKTSSSKMNVSTSASKRSVLTMNASLTTL